MPDARSPTVFDDTAGAPRTEGAQPALCTREIIGWDMVQLGCERDRRDASESCFQEARQTPVPATGRFTDRRAKEVSARTPARYCCTAPGDDRRLADPFGQLMPHIGGVILRGHSCVRMSMEGMPARLVLAREIGIGLAPAAFPHGAMPRSVMQQLPITFERLNAESPLIDLYILDRTTPLGVSLEENVAIVFYTARNTLPEHTGYSHVPGRIEQL